MNYKLPISQLGSMSLFGKTGKKENDYYSWQCIGNENIKQIFKIEINAHSRNRFKLIFPVSDLDIQQT